MTRIVHITGKCFLLFLAFTTILFTSCKREVLSAPFFEGDGLEVTMNIPVGFTDYEVMTRALTENESKTMDDLCLLIFQSSTGKLQFRQYYTKTDLDGLIDAVSQENHSNAKVIPVTLPTGTYKIAAVANTSAGHLTQGLLDKLLDVKNWDEFYNLDIKLNEFSPIDRSRMPMSGYYQIGDVDCAGTLICPDVAITGQGNLGGYIHLRRVDAEVKFNIYNDIDGHYAGLDGVSGDYLQKCTKFEILGWQLVNMPASAFISEHETDQSDATYVSTIWQGITRPDPNVGDGAWKLEFYMMENRKSATGLTKYEQRELNEANEGRAEDEDPHFVNAPKNSTYLKFTANIEISLTKGQETIKRIASATYYVHLGATYPKGGTAVVDYNDFRTARNTKYTYNVRVQGVDKIVVEAISTEDPNDNFQNGQEGMVVDLAGGKVIDLDAHYAVFNIELSRLEMSQMGIIITSAAHPSGVSYIPGAGPGGEDINNLNITCDDYQHIRFAPLSAQTATIPDAELVVYSNTYDVKALTEHPTEAQAKEGGILPLEAEPTQVQDQNHYVPLYDFITLKKSYPLLNDGHDDDPITFTVFVSEYYYYNDFNLHHDTDLGEENWQKFTNTINRQYSILSNVDVSTDEHSTHVTGKYVINQRSIQTYYGMDSEEGLGIEHVNEHYHKNMVGSAPSTKRTNNGWFNSAFYMGLMTNSGSATNNALWADWAYQDRAIGHEDFNDFYPTFKTKFSNGLIGDGNYKGGKNRISADDRNVNYYAIPACLARNRDLNRNGIIETDELRWFLPGIQQYVQFAIGIAALETPIFRPADFESSLDSDTNGGRANSIYGNVRYHFISSDHWKMWSEEGTSISSLGNNSVGNAWEIRCCRYLKANGQYTSNDSQLIVAHPYNHNDVNRVVNVHGYDAKCLRENTGVLPVRDNFDTKWNSLARNFQYASTTISRPNAGSAAALAHDVDENVYCKTYHDPAFGSDMTDVGTWRIPNQRELAILFYEHQASDGYFAGTFWYYGNFTNNIVYGYDDVAAESGSKYFGNFGIRSGNLCLNHSNNLNTCRVIRCVRDTDKAGNPAGSPEYGNPINFIPGEFTCTYNSDGTANYSVGSSMDASATVVGVTINDDNASSTGSGEVVSSASNVEVTNSFVTVIWKIRSAEGRILTYKQSYPLPARYWTISRYGYENRYAYVNADNGRTAIGNEYNQDINELDAIYKWVLTTSPTGEPVNVTELQTDVTYYLYNAGAKAYINGYQGTSGSYLTTGANAIPVKLTTDGDHPGYYVIRFNNATNANSNGGVQNFGTWNSVDNGSNYTLKPVVLRGEMPFRFTAGQCATDYDQVDGTRATFTVDATFESGVSELVSVIINGRPLENPSVSGDNIHCVATNSLIPEDGRLAVRWTFNKDGEVIVKDHTYDLPVKFYLMSSILSNASWGYQYAYVDEEGKTRSNTMSSDMDKSRAGMMYRWILSGNTPSATQNIPVSEIVNNSNRRLYLYNLDAAGYIMKPSPVDNTAQYFPTGNTAHPFCFDANRNGGFRPYFKWDTNAYGSCADASRNHDKTKFGLSPAGVDGGYWKFIPVYRDNGPSRSLTFVFDENIIVNREPEGFSVHITTDTDAVPTSVTIDGRTATVSGSNGDYTATVVTSVTGKVEVATTWIMSFDGRSETRSKTYTLPDPYRATRLTHAQIAAMAEGESMTVVFCNPTNTKPVFFYHNGTSAALQDKGFNSAATLASAANACANDDNYHFILTKVSGGYTIKSFHGGFSPNRNGGSVSWSTTPDVLSLTNYTGGSTSAIVEWVAACSVRIEKSGAWINVNGPVYNTGGGDWVKQYFYKVEPNY